MRLNFSGSDEDEIREGIRRIGNVVSEQVDLYQTITGEHKLPAGPAEGSTSGTQNLPPRPGDVVPLRRRQGS
jgi:2-aminoadipate transaminase